MLKKLIAATVLVAATASIAQADLNAQMNSLFGSMTNVTAPMGYMDQSRGVVSAGQLTVKNKIVSGELISFEPPSIDSGCGGINWFGGNFSFISADQFVSLMRAIPANAIGYGFKLALGAMCPSCEKVMAELEKTARTLNSIASDSCKATMSMFNLAGIKSSENQGGFLEELASTAATKLGDFNDDFAGKVNKLNSPSPSNKLTPGELKNIIGNVAWVVINTRGDNGKKMIDFYAFGDKSFAEAVMTLTGTIIVKKAEDGDEQKMVVVQDYRSTLGLKDLLGEKDKETVIEIRTCPDTSNPDVGQQCLNPTDPKPAPTLEPMIRKVRRVLLGANGGGGSESLVGKFIHHQGAFLTPEEKSFMEMVPQHGKRIRDLSIYNPPGAITYAEIAGEKIALDIISDLVHAILDEVQQAAATSNHANIAAFLDNLVKVRMEVYEEERRINADIQSRANVDSLFADLMKQGDRSASFQTVAAIEKVDKSKTEVTP